MDPRRTVYLALKALRDSGLVTDRTELNRAYSELTTTTERNPR